MVELEDEVSAKDFSARRAFGRAARRRSPRAGQGEWAPPDDRFDPVALLEEQAETRVTELVPIRYGRMMVSPFTFYRGAALIMAADLAATPVSGITVQLCGDAHLSNFGLFGTPERTMIFDLNDFDETLPGPWEWDLKRLVASFEVAGRYRAFTRAQRQAIALAVTRGYRERMSAAASAPVLQAWYDRVDAEHVLAWVKQEKAAEKVGRAQVKRTGDVIAKARTKDSMSAFSKLVGLVDGELRILADPPLIEPLEDLVDDTASRVFDGQVMEELIDTYTGTLLDAHHPVREYTYRHMARKVVGVGSVGTRAWVLLLTGRDDGDPLLLQAKEAQASVLERYLPASAYETHGERVVRGQRLMQSASDVFLGWQQVEGQDGITRDFYLRQLHDWKGSVDTDASLPAGAKMYARLCGEALARAHARSGDRVAIAGYLGGSDKFDHLMADFASAYADQNERDYLAFMRAIADGRLDAQPGL